MTNPSPSLQQSVKIYQIDLNDRRNLLLINAEICESDALSEIGIVFIALVVIGILLLRNKSMAHHTIAASE